jgi:hypothetical protein
MAYANKLASLMSPSDPSALIARFVGAKVEFGADTDEFALNVDARALPRIHSDPYLNDLLLKYCEAALAARRGDTSQLRTRVENAISSLLPHGRVLVEDVARSLGMSEDACTKAFGRGVIHLIKRMGFSIHAGGQRSGADPDPEVTLAGVFTRGSKRHAFSGAVSGRFLM